MRRHAPSILSDRKSTRLNSSHLGISYAVFCFSPSYDLYTLSLHDALPIFIKALAFGRDGEERPVLGADGVVGRDHARLAVARELCAIDEIEDRGAGAEVEDHAAPRAFDLVVLAAAGPAQDRRHPIERRDRLRQLRGHEHRLAVLLQPLLGQRDQREHALISFARAGPEGEDAVLV